MNNYNLTQISPSLIEIYINFYVKAVKSKAPIDRRPRMNNPSP